MNTAAKELRPYQVRLVTDVCRATGDILVEQPTGSGKTVQIVTLVAMHLGQRYTHAVIAAPQQQIEQGFVKRDYLEIKFPECKGAAVSSIQAPKSLINGARESRLGSVKRIVQYLRQPGPLDHAFACTHAALNQLTPDALPDNLAGKALFIDEAHHASADGLSQLVTLWRERGGQLFFFTATPYRGDGRPVKLEGMRTFRRSLAEHMAEGFAPRHLDSEIVALGQPGDAITAGQFTGEEAPPSSYFEGLIAAICRRWLEDGKPKAIVRVPPMQGGKSGELVSRLMQDLSSHGARVLDATGTGAADKQRFLTALDAEKNRTHASSEFDVMVGIQRVLEGTDWPVCSAVYCVGMPGSLNTVVQFLGRAMRLKGEDYPAEQRDRAKLVFFVPCGGGAALADLSLDHSRHALLTCCFLADHEVGQEWIVLREVRRGIEAALGSRAENPAAADAENEADVPLDLEVRAEIELLMANVREQITSEGGEPTVGEVAQLAAMTRPDLPEAAIPRVAAEVLASTPGTSGDQARKTIHREIARTLRINPQVKEAMEEAFAVVLEEFREVTLKDSAVLESVRRQVHGLTGGQMKEFAKRLRDAVPRPLTEEQILEWADKHRELTSQWPVETSGEISHVPGEKWTNVSMALRLGLRGLLGNSSLAQLLAEKRGVRHHLILPILTEAVILGWADEHRNHTGKWPSVVSGPVRVALDENWNAIDAALTNGLRGLLGGSSVAKLLTEYRGRRNLKNQPPLSIEQILFWADEYKTRTGSWPKQESGGIEGESCEKWANINAALSQGLRGLPGGTSLAQILSEHRNVRNIRALPPLRIDAIPNWADSFHQRTSHWPKQNSGPVVDAPGETWSGISVALAQGHRGLPGGSSLAQLLDEKRGVRNLGVLPELTEDQILAWADAHFAQVGQWPKRGSGLIQDTLGETWTMIGNALAQGHRGLPGGSSLAQLLDEKRGVRNLKALPELVEDQILLWAVAHRNRMGKLPNRLSGRVDEAPEETWGNIDAALRNEARGSSGESSLAKLFASRLGARNKKATPKLTEAQILAWCDTHKELTGNWPHASSGPITNAHGETWTAVHIALSRGTRGLPGGSSLAKLLARVRGVRNIHDLPALTKDQICDWIVYHQEKTGKWPCQESGEVFNAPGETWKGINHALRLGMRGLPAGSSLARFITEHHGNSQS